MYILNGVEDLDEELCGFLLLQAVLVLDVAHEVALLGELHYHIDLFSRFDDFVELYDAAVVDGLQDCDFPADALDL